MRGGKGSILQQNRVQRRRLRAQIEWIAMAGHAHSEVAFKAGQRAQSVLQSQGVAEEAKTPPFVSCLRAELQKKQMCKKSSRLSLLETILSA
jgi:hypothetical protein